MTTRRRAPMGARRLVVITRAGLPLGVLYHRLVQVDRLLRNREELVLVGEDGGARRVRARVALAGAREAPEGEVRVDARLRPRPVAEVVEPAVHLEHELPPPLLEDRVL